VRASEGGHRVQGEGTVFRGHGTVFRGTAPCSGGCHDDLMVPPYCTSWLFRVWRSFRDLDPPGCGKWVCLWYSKYLISFLVGFAETFPNEPKTNLDI
jgi:hypothetical protein